MTMNSESRKRAVAAMIGTDDFVEGSIAHVRASEYLDRLLAAGFHVAEWRKVEEAEDGSEYLVFNRNQRYDIGKSDWPAFTLPDGFPLEGASFPVVIMDLPDPPKTEGDA